MFYESPNDGEQQAGANRVREQVIYRNSRLQGAPAPGASLVGAGLPANNL